MPSTSGRPSSPETSGIGFWAHALPAGVVPAVTYVPSKKISLPPAPGRQGAVSMRTVN